jgi:hypothetical protein
VAFHVEIRRGHRWAREFNLDSERLRREVLEPWTDRRTIRLGDRDWEPAECTLRILEAPELDGPDLGFGRGWDRAERAGRSVTRELVADAAREAAAIAVLAETDSAREAVVGALRELGTTAVDWPAGADVEPAALVLAVETADPPRPWLYEAGAAVGAMGGRTVVAHLTDAPRPPELAELLSVESGRDLATALGEALRQIGSG